MGKAPIDEVVTGSLAEHPAVKAWCELQHAGIQPAGIDVLKRKHKVATYRLSGIGPGGAAVIAKRCRAPTAKVERMIYTEILPRLPVSALHCYGFAEAPDGEFCWLFLEEASGEPYSPQRADHRALAGRWLGRLHVAPLSAEMKARLPDRGPSHYLQRLRGVRATVGEHLGNPALPADDLSLLRTVAGHCDTLESHWDEVEACCAAMPRSLVHADFVIKNLRVRAGLTGPELLVFDWELAHWGVPATDLAQIVGRAASPDLNVYGSAVQRDFGGLDARDIQRLADCGKLLRVVDELYWATTFIGGSSYKFFVRPISHFRICEPELATAFGAMKWTKYG